MTEQEYTPTTNDPRYPEFEALEQELFKHQPVLSMHDGSIAGCQCMDRVFVRKSEDWGTHLASVFFDLLAAHDREVREECAKVAENIYFGNAPAFSFPAAHVWGAQQAAKHIRALNKEASDGE